MAKLQETVRTHGGGGTGTGAIDVHLCSGQFIDPHGVRMQGRCKGTPTAVVMQTAPHDCEPIIGTIEALDGLPRRGSPRPKPVAHPGFDVYQAMSTPGHNGTEPARADPAQAETLPVAVGGKMVVQQGGQTHPLPLLQSERHIVHSLRDDGRYLVHAQSLAPSPMYLQIWANRKSIGLKVNSCYNSLRAIRLKPKP